MSWGLPVPPLLVGVVALLLLLVILRWPTPVPRWIIETYGTTLAVPPRFG
jgi:hypothetical protein